MRNVLTAALLLATPALAAWPPPNYAVYYGPWNAAQVAQAWNYRMVVAHPGQDFANLDAPTVAKIQAGRDGKKGTADDVSVLGYLSLGEEEGTPVGPPYASRYLDKVTYVAADGFIKMGPDGKPELKDGSDGIPDENGVWGSYYVNPGDAGWQDLVDARARRIAALGVDGFFFDTLDTASPWGRYGSVEDAMAGLVAHVRGNYPKLTLVGNRGLFMLPKLKPNLNGVLFESFSTDWDWARQRGIFNPWAQSNKDILSQAAGLTILFLNYISPNQPDRLVLMHAQKDLQGDFPGPNYVALPDLQKFGTLRLARLSDALVPNFKLTLEGTKVTSPAPPGWSLEVRALEQPGSPAATPPWPLVNGSLHGLKPQTTYTLYGRVVGPGSNLVSAWSEAKLTTGTYPAPAEELVAASREGAVELSWKAGASPYQVTVDGKPYASVTETHVRVPRPNGVTTAFSVNDSKPVYASASDCTPLPAPKGLKVALKGQTITASWQPVKGASYRLYAVPQGWFYRIPVKTEATTGTVSSAPGTYSVFVTTVDGAGNQSQPGERVQVTVH